MQVITSKENTNIKHIIKLKEKKYRNEYCEFLIEGVKLFKEAVKEKSKIKSIIVSENFLKDFLKEKLDSFPYIVTTNSIFKQITDVESPQGILAVIEKKSNLKKINFMEDIILILDNIQDPGNLGTIIRTADSIRIKTDNYFKRYS